MGILSEKVKLELLLNGNGALENYKNNSLYFYELYKKSNSNFEILSVDKLYPGMFSFFHYIDESNWMKWSPVFIADYKKFSNKIILFCVNFNLIPLEVRVMIFDKFITERDFVENRLLKVDLEGIYNELRKLGFEYSIMEYDASRIELAHRVNLNLLPRFLYHQHPKNIYDPEKLLSIWSTKIKNRDKRHQEMTVSILSEFYDVNSEILEKYNVLESHIKRLRRNIEKYG